MPVELGTCATGDDVKLSKVPYTHSHKGVIDRETEEETVCVRILSQR